MSHIFISYSRRDIDFAQKIVDALAANDLDTWIDWKSIPKGEDWEQEIYRGIEEADAFLFLISSDSVASEMCNKEIAHALKNNKRIIPIFIGNSDVYTVKKSFLYENQRDEIWRRNFIFCREGQDEFDKAIEETRETIHIDYEWLKYHTQLQNKALAWERGNDTSRLLRGKELREAEQKLANAGAQKDPQPTSLQRQYILVSQHEEVRIRRQIIAGLVISVAIMAVLSFVAWLQRNEAVSQRAIAQAASTSAMHEANTRATAQADAEAQARIALARQLATQAELIHTTQRDITQSLLLAVQSMRLFPNPEASLFLQRTIDLIPTPLNQLSVDSEIVTAAFSLDNKQLFIITSDQVFHIWDWDHGQELGRFGVGYNATEIIQAPHDKRILLLGEGEVSVWDIETKTNLREFQPDGGVVLAISSDLHWLIGRDSRNLKILRIYDLSEEESPELLIHQEAPTAFAISPDNQWLVTGSANGSIQLWNLGSNIPEYEISLQSTIETFTFSADSRFLAVLTSNDEVFVLDAVDGQIVYKTTVDGGDVTHPILFSPENNKLIIGQSYIFNNAFGTETGAVERMIDIVDVGKWSVVAQVIAPIDGGLVFHQQGRLAAFFGGEWVYIVDLFQDEVISKLQNNYDVERVVWDHSDFPFWIAAIPFPSACDLPLCVNALQVWNLDTLESLVQIGAENTLYANNSNSVAAAWSYQSRVLEIYSLEPRQEVSITSNKISTYPPAGQISFSPSGERLAVNHFNSKLYVYTVPLFLTSQIYNFDLPVEINDSVNAFDMSPDDLYLATAGRDGVIRLWDVTTGQEKKHFVPKINSTEEITKVVFSPDGVKLVSTQGNNMIIWDAIKGTKYSSTRFDDNIIEAFYSPNGEILVLNTYSDNAKYRCLLWDVRNKNVLKEFRTNCLEFSPDGKSLLGVEDQSLFILSIDTGLEQKRIVDGGAIIEAKFSPDGLYVLTVTYEGKSRIWEISSGNLISQLWQPADIVSSADISPDGQRIAMIGAYNNIVRLVYWKPGFLISKACERVNRNLSLAEWRIYLGDEPYRATCPNLPIPNE